MYKPAKGETQRAGLRIASYEALNASPSGNPRFLVRFTDGTRAETQADASCNWDVESFSPRYGQVMSAPSLTVTFTRGGRITYLEKES